MPSVRLFHGDCIEIMRSMPEASVDSIVTDPPYGLEFMKKEWDSFKVDNPSVNGFQFWFTQVATEALRVLKPGGHILSFGGTRTYHRMAAALEDAGFEIRDSIHWIYGSGFPKSHDVSKAIDKAAGATREVVGTKRSGIANPTEGTRHTIGASAPIDVPITAPATEDAKRWEGWGTALKPAHEPVVVARKPLDGTVALNVLKWGTGALNIDGCRVGTDDTTSKGRASNSYFSGRIGEVQDKGEERVSGSTSGRWPANIVFTHSPECVCVGEVPDSIVKNKSFTDTIQSEGWGTKKAVTEESEHLVEVWECVDGCPMPELDRQSSDKPQVKVKGNASKFFTQSGWGEADWPFVYCPKPSKKERNAGLEELEDKARPVHIAQLEGMLESQGGDRVADKVTKNHHPTVKPVALMRHLIRLCTPPDGTVLDPFSGSGTTLVAAVLEGFDAIGCEMTDEYLPIIEGRVFWAKNEVGDFTKTEFEVTPQNTVFSPEADA